MQQKIHGLSEHMKRLHLVKMPKSTARHVLLVNCHICGSAHLSHGTDDLNTIKHHQMVHERKDKKIAAIKKQINSDKCPAISVSKQAFHTHRSRLHLRLACQCDLCGI
ncbi:hypothetical protein ACKWTF_014956 [Chironomus riparius]